MSLLKTALGTLIKNPVIFFPFYCLAFVQLLVLELIFFMPRYPLSIIFGPIITKTAGPAFMHYPFNYMILSKWFHSIDLWVYMLVSCIFYAVTVQVIASINSDHKIDFKKVFQKAFASYFDLAAVMILAVLTIKGVFMVYGILVRSLLLIHPANGFIMFIQRIFSIGGPFIQLLISSLVSTVFAFVIPIIIMEQKKVIPALALNFKKFRHLWGIVFIVFLITEIPYIPFVLFQSARMDQLLAVKVPELSGVYLVISTLVILLIDVFQYTAITLCFLFKKEERS